MFVADASLGNVATVTHWSRVISGGPEPSTTLLLLAGELACCRRRR